MEGREGLLRGGGDGFEEQLRISSIHLFTGSSKYGVMWERARRWQTFITQRGFQTVKIVESFALSVSTWYIGLGLTGPMHWLQVRFVTFWRWSRIEERHRWGEVGVDPNNQFREMKSRNTQCHSQRQLAGFESKANTNGDNSSKTFTLLLKDEVVAKLELFRIIYCQSSIGFAGRFRSFVARSPGAPRLVPRYKNPQQLPAAQDKFESALLPQLLRTAQLYYRITSWIFVQYKRGGGGWGIWSAFLNSLRTNLDKAKWNLVTPRFPFACFSTGCK